MPTSYGEMAENNVVINTVLRSKQMNEGDRVKKVHPTHTLGGESRCIEGAWRGSRRNNLSFLQLQTCLMNYCHFWLWWCFFKPFPLPALCGVLCDTRTIKFYVIRGCRSCSIRLHHTVCLSQRVHKGHDLQVRVEVNSFLPFKGLSNSLTTQKNPHKSIRAKQQHQPNVNRCGEQIKIKYFKANMNFFPVKSVFSQHTQSGTHGTTILR